MRKSILLLSGVGIGAGLLYALSRDSKKAAPDQGANGKQGTSASVQDNGQNANRRGADVGVSALAGSSMKPADEAHLEPEIDDRGTNQHKASEILKSVRDRAFDASDEKLALALGRPTEEIEAWTSGDGTIDGDVIMKARALADQRGIEIQ